MTRERLCANCGERPGAVVWGDALAVSHGWAARWCEICALTAQIDHARERAALLPELERRLTEAQATPQGEAEHDQPPVGVPRGEVA